jgi:hypothetical protein
VAGVETLDRYVLKALEFFEREGDFRLELPESRSTIVAGTQNGLLAGQLVYRLAGRRFSEAREAGAKNKIDLADPASDDVTIVSASGSRNVVPLAGYALSKGFRVNAIVCARGSELSRAPGVREIFVPAADEPHTVNVSTYGNIIRGVTHEKAGRILDFVAGMEKTLGFIVGFERFHIILPDEMHEVAAMADWKMNETFGRRRGRASYLTNAMHGSGVNRDPHEAIVAIGADAGHLLDETGKSGYFSIRPPDWFGPLAYMMASYYIAGAIQRLKNDTNFQDNIAGYAKRAAGWKWASHV